ncbi:MAG: hypothetical protein HC806_03215 [Anaerolineae bacterium]|nr:hypothetical protein [Anaerolineae bacterium]
MYQSILKLLRLRLRLWWNSIKHRPMRQKIGLAFAGFGMLVFAAFLVFISWGILQFFSNPRIQTALTDAGVGNTLGDLLTQLPVILSIGAFVIGLFANFGVLLQGLYLSGDMEFLLTAPLPARAVFLSKLVQAILPNLLLIGLVSAPALIGLGLAQGYTLLYYVLVPIILSVLVILGAGLSSILVMLIVRVVNPRRAAEVLGLVGGLTAFICSQSGQLAGSFGDVELPTEQIADAASAYSSFATPWNPLAWPGMGLIAIGQGDWLTGLGFSLITLVLTLSLFAVTLTFAERMYFSGWARVQVGTKNKKTQSPRHCKTFLPSGIGGALREHFPCPRLGCHHKGCPPLSSGHPQPFQSHFPNYSRHYLDDFPRSGRVYGNPRFNAKFLFGKQLRHWNLYGDDVCHAFWVWRV